MRYLELEEILRLHFEIINDFGGLQGVREENRLRSVVDAPKQAVFGVQQYNTLFEKAAVYVRNIIVDHPFADGNKRTGITCMGIFLMKNNHQLTATTQELEEFAVLVAVEHLDIEEIANWLKQNSKPDLRGTVRSQGKAG